MYWCFVGMILMVFLVTHWLWSPLVDWILSEPASEFPFDY